MLRRVTLALSLALAVGRFNDNKTVWGQDDDQIVVTIKADCDMATTHVNVLADRFTFSCKAWNWREEWETVVVDFVTREDVKPDAKLKCAKRDRTAGYLDQVTCKVDKFHAGHLWDRLTWEEQALDLRYDWGLTETSDDFGDDPGSAAYATPFDQPYAGSEDKVKSYSAAELRAATDVYDAVFADVRWPFCNLCDFYANAVVDAAERFPGVLEDEATGLSARFAVLDGFDVHRDLARRLGAKCDYTCPLAVIKKDQPPRLVPRPFYGGDLSELYAAIRPVIVEMEEEDALEVATTSRTVVARFRDGSVLSHLFEGMAEAHRPHQHLMDINFIKVVDLAPDAALGLTAYSPAGETNFLANDAAAETNLTAWVGWATADKILKYDPDSGGQDFTVTKFIGDRGVKSELHVFIGDSCPKRMKSRCAMFFDALEGVADDFRGKVQVRLHETHASSPLTDYGTELNLERSQEDAAKLLAAALPIVGFKADALDFFGKNYFLPMDPLKVLTDFEFKDKLAAWVQACLDGDAAQWLRSVEPPAAQFVDTKVYAAVGSTVGSAVFGDATHQAPTVAGVAALPEGPWLGETLLHAQVDFFDAKGVQKQASLEKMADVLDGIPGIRAAHIAAGPENDMDRARFVDAADDKHAGTNHKADIDGFWFVPSRDAVLAGARPARFAPKKASKKKKGKNFSAQLLEFMEKHSAVLAGDDAKFRLKANVAKANHARATGADFDEL